jgi:hypothetical protein
MAGERVVLGEVLGSSGNVSWGATGGKVVAGGRAGGGGGVARAQAALGVHAERLARGRGELGPEKARTSTTVVPAQLAATAAADAPPRLAVARSVVRGGLGRSSVGTSLPGSAGDGTVVESAAQGKLRLAAVPPPRVPSAETRARLAAEARRVSGAALSERLRRVRKHIIHAQAELSGPGGAVWAAKHHLQTALGSETETPVPGGWPMGVAVRVLVEEAQAIVRDFPRSAWSTPARLGAAALVVHTYTAMIEARSAFHAQPFHAPLHRVVDVARADFAAALAKFQEASVLAEREEAARALERDQRLLDMHAKDAARRARRRRRRIRKSRALARHILSDHHGGDHEHGDDDDFHRADKGDDRSHRDLTSSAAPAPHHAPEPHVLVDFGLDE